MASGKEVSGEAKGTISTEVGTMLCERWFAPQFTGRTAFLTRVENRVPARAEDFP